MKMLAFILNLPWTIILLLAVVISLPRGLSLRFTPLAIIINVHSFWYYQYIPSQKGVQAMTLGDVILLGPRLLDNDLRHELVHISQYEKAPFIHPLLSFVETLRYGYVHNKYEVQAYSISNSTFLGRKL